MEGSPPTAAGLREYKKARTREAISDVATRLFVERGYEAVTMAEIAEAAEVSVKTIFNHFNSKEELFFDRADHVIGALADAVLERPAGTSVVEALHRVLADRRVPFDTTGWASLRDSEGYERFRAFVATEHAAPALRARRLVIAQGWIDRLAATLAAARGAGGAQLRDRALAAMVMAAMGLREQALSAAMLERASARQVERRVRAVVDEAFRRIAAAFPDDDAPEG
ncbi:MAG TPA: helix-turn-helix domain-containing protein [Baekduia sp.]|nr:helix-turn-helix domain-containing protein [Baekduia sp.]